MYIYGLTNKTNGNQYWGQDSVGHPLRPKGRASRHLKLTEPACRAIHNAIKKYGADNFDVEIIHYPGASIEALNAIEEWYISKNNSQSPNGYNLHSGGENRKPSKESRQRMSESHKGKNTGEDHPLYGKSHTKETKQKISKTKTGTKDSPATRLAKSKAQTERYKDPAERQKMSDSGKKDWVKRKHNPNQLKLF